MLDKAIMICGAGHSGSTLLGFILGSLPGTFYMGEGAKIRFLHDPSKPLHKRVCKFCGPDCAVWSDFHCNRSSPVYVQVAAHTGATRVVDSSKNTAWISARAAELAAEPAQGYLIRLLRDGRAVMNSRFRKYPDRDPEQQIVAWMTQIRATNALYDGFSGPKTTVHYEELATLPEKTTHELCGFLGVVPDPGILEYGQKQHHPLGGNNGTQYLVARQQGGGRGLASQNSRSREYYDAHSGAIELDLRWRAEMPTGHVELFERLAGNVNGDMKWGDSEHDEDRFGISKGR